MNRIPDIITTLKPTLSGHKLVQRWFHGDQEFQEEMFGYFRHLGMFFEADDLFQSCNLESLLYNMFDMRFSLQTIALHQAACNYVHQRVYEEHVIPVLQESMEHIKDCDVTNCTNLCLQYMHILDSKHVHFGLVVLQHKRHVQQHHPKSAYHAKAKLPNGYVIVAFNNPVPFEQTSLCLYTEAELPDCKYAVGIMYMNCLIACGEFYDLSSQR